MSRAALRQLTSLLSGRKVAVLTGAGCSTESGIPDYRGPETARRARNPIQGREFARNAEVRARYWARSMIGWRRMVEAEPNAAHRALAELEERGIVSGIITQNVDGLHLRAGSRKVVELHGVVSEVVCLGCGEIESRAAVQRRLEADNPDWKPESAEIAPDGDADVSETAIDFVVPSCLACGGILKPRVVFFGESVPAARVERAYAMVEHAEALLVVGSSLTVLSGYRFVRRASQLDLPIGIVNLGPTRGDALATVCVDARAGSVLPELAAGLG